MLKTVAVNSFIAWRMNTKEALWRKRDTFRDLDRYRSTLNSLEALSDFMFDASQGVVTV